MILYASMATSELGPVRFYIEVNNINCCLCDLETGNKEEKKKNLLAKNPSGIVPFLDDSDIAVVGSVAILLYLAEKYAKFEFFGKTLEARAKVEGLMFWAHNILWRLIMNEQHHQFRSENHLRYQSLGKGAEQNGKWAHSIGSKHNPSPHALVPSSVYHDFVGPRLNEAESIGEFETISLVSHAKSEITNHFEVLEKQYLANSKTRFLIGNELTIADIYVSITIASLQSVMFDFTPWPGLCKWAETIKAEILRVSQRTRLSRITSNNN